MFSRIWPVIPLPWLDHGINRGIQCLVFFLLFFPFYCCAAPIQSAKIAIIIDDIGYLHDAGMRIVNLPGPIVCSILPYTPFGTEIANAAYTAHKEIILHTPMQAITNHSLGPGGLNENLDETQFSSILNKELLAVPHITGINNHMGSLLTQSSEKMEWVMQTVKLHHLFFIDSKTSGKSVAENIAKDDAVPTAGRDIFLDNVPTTEAVQEQFNQLIAIAKHKGSAIAIGHPFPATINFLAQALPQLKQQNIELVPVTELLKHSPIMIKKIPLKKYTSTNKKFHPQNSQQNIYTQFCQSCKNLWQIILDSYWCFNNWMASVIDVLKILKSIIKNALWSALN